MASALATEPIAPQAHPAPPGAVEEIGPREALRLIARAFRYVLPFKGRFAIKALLTLASILQVLYVPWPLKIILDHVIRGAPIGEGASRYPPFIMPFVRFIDGKSPAEMMFWVCLLGGIMVLLIGAFGQEAAAADRTNFELAAGHDNATQTENQANTAWSLASGLLGIFEFRWQLRLSQALNHYYRSQLFERIKTLPMATLDDQRIGDTIYRVMYDAPMITRLCYDVLLIPTLSTASFFTNLYMLNYSFGSAPEVVWIAALAFPCLFLFTIPFARMTRRRNLASRTAGARTTGTIEESMSNILAVQSLGGWKRERERFDTASRRSFSDFRRVVATTIMTETAAGFARQVLYMGAIAVIASNIIRGTFTVGDYAAIFVYYAWMVGAAADAAQVWVRLQDNVVGVRRVFWLLDLPAETDEGTRELGPIREGVSIRHASVVYPDGRRALEDVSLEARIGEVVAIVGATGAGKTSLAYLIPRFLKSNGGQVLIDGVDVNEVTLQSLRPQISYVFQETHLFSGTVAENIRYAEPDTSQAEIERAARIAGAHDFIVRLPQGYESRVGQRGSTLSVGQKQRIAIARGLLRQTPILILDEPSSALDSETETALVNALREAARDRLVLIIAHRLSTITHADRIVFLERGRVREQGRHHELMANPTSAYRRYVALQTQQGEVVPFRTPAAS